jgi:RNA polymerase sigma factor (sigma-70 family)
METISPAPAAATAPQTAAAPPAAPALAAGGHSLRLSRLSDELLARQVMRGSERAFAALYERYHQPLYRYCRSIVRDDADAQDVLQSTFAAALTALGRAQRSAPLRPWLFRIAHNESISLLRRRRRDGAQDPYIAGPQVASSAEDEATERARWATLVSDLGELPERARGALLLRELSGLSHEEIAVALETTVGGAKQSIFEARQALSALEEGRAMSCEDIRRRISEGDRRVLRGRRVAAHLRDCPACDRFAAAIPARRSELRAFAPVLPPLAAAALLSRSLHAGAAQGGAGAAGSAATAGVVGKAAGTAIAWKALTGAALVVTAAAGVGGLAHVLQRHAAATTAPASRTAGPLAAGGRAAPGHASAATVAAAQRRSAAAQASAASVNSHGNRGHSAGVAGAVAGAQGIRVSASGRAAHANSSHGASTQATTKSHSAARHAAKGSPSTNQPPPSVTHAGAPPKPHGSNAGGFGAVAQQPATHGDSLSNPARP